MNREEIKYVIVIIPASGAKPYMYSVKNEVVEFDSYLSAWQVSSELKEKINTKRILIIDITN